MISEQARKGQGVWAARTAWLGPGTGGLLAALLLVSLNLRLPITALPPVISTISEALGLTTAQAGLLTSIPVLCFALFAPPASWLIGRIGPERALLIGLGAIVAGQLLRPLGGAPALFLGTAAFGAGITVGNVAVPVLITRDFRSRAASVTALYSSVMNVGSSLSTMATAPLAVLWGWQWALLSWTALAVLAAGFWHFTTRRPSLLLAADAAPVATPAIPSPPTTASTAPNPIRRLTVLLCLGFVGQAGSFFAMTAWLPRMLVERGGFTETAAGAIASPFQLLAVAGALGVPLAFRAGASHRTVSLTLTALWLTLPLGLLLAPTAAAVWTSAAGLAQGGNFVLTFTLIAQRAPSLVAARRASAVVQTVAYVFAAISPLVVGALHTATASWTAPLLVVLGLVTTMGAFMAVATAPQPDSPARPGDPAQLGNPTQAGDPVQAT
ncbi:MAG: MFS transporter [Promicromonosporaceae bacterium]|nr:MFS transporter [Promicromonosporaceae bacterium]